MSVRFVLRSGERGHERLVSTGINATYVAGHPDALITRRSSFNFHDYQAGIAGFGKIRVFGDEVFSGAGCGYNMHPHHNFIIMAFVLAGSLTHVNTIGKIDVLKAGDFYVFSAGSGGKHAELNIEQEDLQVIYLWVLPADLSAQPSYVRSSFDAAAGRNRIVGLVGDQAGALPIGQVLKVSRLQSDANRRHVYRPDPANGVYAFALEGMAEVAGTILERRDSIGLGGVDQIEITAKAKTDLLLVETAL
jgi:redox-sensitive bicupin YhaK (pirin superfamily)